MLKTTFEFAAAHPIALWVIAAFCALAMQVGIDLFMGEKAEYFNAAGVFAAWGGVLSGADPLTHHFLVGQERLGVWALPAGTALLVAQPFAIGGVLALTLRLILRN